MLENFGTAWEFLVAAFGPMGPFFALGAFGTLMVALSAPALLKRRVDPFDKLAAPQLEPRGANSVTLRYDGGRSRFDRFAPYLEPRDQKEFSATRLKLIQAGYRTRSAVSTYHLARFLLGTTLLSVGLLYVLIRGETSTSNAILTVLCPGLMGYFFPSYWVTRRRQQRREEITNGFPDALDLMLVCVEAGQSLDQAILRVAMEMRSGYPTLAEEFEIVANEVRAGKERQVVLKDLAERCGVSDISAFVTVLVQSASFGTSIADALRVYANEMRDKRVMRAEEKANKLPTKLTLGTMLFTVPPLLIILIGPSVYDIARNLTALSI